MKQNRENNYKEMDTQLVTRNQGQHYLPSTEVREVVPEFRDEIDLRDLIDTLIRRKTVVLICLIF